MSILILGGTAEADQLADKLWAKGVGFTYSLAGVTPNPKPRVYPTQVGGFGGVSGLVRYLKQKSVNMVIDATHPFAFGMTQNAIAAATQTNIALLRFERPAWQEPDGADWTHVKNLSKAAESLPPKSRVFLSVGSQSMAAFSDRQDVNFTTRSIKTPDKPFGKIIIAKPPFDVAGETKLFTQNRITHLVSKNAGGDQTKAKLVAAQQLGIRVIMVERPPSPVAEITLDLDATLAWIERRL